MAHADTKVVDLVTESLLPGRRDNLRAMFNAEGLPAPIVIWSPTASELQSPRHRQFAQICRDHEDTAGHIAADDVQIEDFGALADWLMVLDVEAGGEDFRYAYYGRSISNFSGLDMTGKRTSEFRGYLSTFFRGLYRAVLRTGRPVFSMHEPPKDVVIRSWQRLIVPLFGKTGDVTRLLTINVPDNEFQVGLELLVDPVFVVRADGSVIYSNRAARMMFNAPVGNGHDATLSDLTGIGLDMPDSPEDLLSQNRVIDSLVLAPRGSIMERLAMTVSAAEHRGQAFFVVVMRTIGA